MLTTFTSYQLITKDLQKSLARTAADPVIARDTAYYRENIGKVKSIDDFLGDRRLYAYAMKAYGLEDMTYAKAFMRRILTEGIDEKTSFANRLADERYKSFGAAFNFVRYGEVTTSLEAANEKTVENYMRQSLEATAGEEDQGVRLALYFQRKAAEISGPFDILADPALLQVVQTTLGLPEGGNIDAQAAMIKHRLDIESLKDPKETERFLKRFAIMWDATNNTATAPVLTLFNSADTGSGMDVDMLMSLQRIKFGGV
ncbi:DUF1217 domain-containing protein [Microvirga flavescens]|uniref:DUF1217 domain-containing protein n=1 Tax=Microvirga flavescens TaxID=2249811 RepID=UPI000DD98E2E|nr:DUF1217 domain-containing protein [Microvirga flavescens]